MNKEQELQLLIKKLHIQGYGVHDSEEGSYCFYCGAQINYTFNGSVCIHNRDCVWLDIEKYDTK